MVNITTATYNVLTKVTDGLKSGLSEHLGRRGVGDRINEAGDQVGPGAVRQLDGTDGGHALRRDRGA